MRKDTIPELDEYPDAILHEGVVYLRPSFQWCKLTSAEIKVKYYLALKANDEVEAESLRAILEFLAREVLNQYNTRRKAKSKPLGWHLRSFAIWMDIQLSRGIRDIHVTAMLQLAQKYGVDYYGNVYKPEW